MKPADTPGAPHLTPTHRQRSTAPTQRTSALPQQLPATPPRAHLLPNLDIYLLDDPPAFRRPHPAFRQPTRPSAVPTHLGPAAPGSHALHRQAPTSTQQSRSRQQAGHSPRPRQSPTTPLPIPTPCPVPRPRNLRSASTPAAYALRPRAPCMLLPSPHYAHSRLQAHPQPIEFRVGVKTRCVHPSTRRSRVPRLLPILYPFHYPSPAPPMPFRFLSSSTKRCVTAIPSPSPLRALLPQSGMVYGMSFDTPSPARLYMHAARSRTGFPLPTHTHISRYYSSFALV
ncbi:hypothetical protein C8F04DRAFT_1277416 [Mycena alexandri]|uniref:Uncharacterized protein n=1 Tax=Mycena alexandri TaxID=1745969 RepID=A0AAD6RZU1_9AGAR|nr:hypothetical protein C8F04DRAFT_1277416 [Mycena alexandri]